MENTYNRYCDNCEGKVVAHAFSDGACTICEENVSTSHTPCDKVCRKCSSEKDICMSCGGPLQKPYAGITKEKLKEAIDYVFRERPKSNPNERKFKMTTYCKGVNGPKTFTQEIGWDLCGHPECHTCRNMENAFKEEAKYFADNILDKNEIEYPNPLSPETEIAIYNEKNKDQYITIEHLTLEEIRRKYEHLLSKKEIKNIKKNGSS